MTQRVLLFPSYRGGGFGHVSRCLALAEELDHRGWKIAFVLGGPHATRVSEQWPVFQPPSPPISTRLWHWLRATLAPNRSHPAYLFFSDLNFQAVRDGFHTPQMVQQEVNWELEIVRRFRPDVLIGDAWLLTSIVGRLAGLPVVQVIRSAAHPAAPQLVWWRDIPSQIHSPDITSIFNPALEQWGLPPIRRAEDLLDGDLLLIPSIPELDPLPPDVQRSHYVGPLTRSEQDSTPIPDWLPALPHDRPVIYVTIGGGSDSVRGQNLLPLWEATFAETNWKVIISTGGRPVPRRWQRMGNLQAYPWVPGRAMIARADVVLFHGGYGTMMETVQAGTPSVVLPFHTEQECNGRRLQQNGAAQVLAPRDEDLEPMKKPWADKELTILACHSVPFRPPQIQAAISSVLTHDHYRSHTTRLQRRQAAYGGPSRSAELLTTLSVS
jgi:UDP:flavonoid glycosyltransferase YjiC (YdhE family)